MQQRISRYWHVQHWHRHDRLISDIRYMASRAHYRSALVNRFLVLRTHIYHWEIKMLQAKFATPALYQASTRVAEFCIHGSVHRNSILVRSNKMQQYADIYLLWNHSTCFGSPSHTSSGIHKTVTAASGTGHSIWTTTFLQCGQISPNLATLEEGCCSDTMTCTRGCSYSLRTPDDGCDGHPKHVVILQ
jgi:hypothetical protein